ncbi:MAG: type II secretion system protein GspD [Candidatus Omnitrophica bacterium]|nr:type II secretion system protein GspD [Candidatus Omnitrophota bacterium]
MKKKSVTGSNFPGADFLRKLVPVTVIVMVMAGRVSAAAADDVPVDQTTGTAMPENAQLAVPDTGMDNVVQPAAVAPGNLADTESPPLPQGKDGNDAVRARSGFSTLNLGVSQDLSAEDFPGLTKRISVDIKGMSIVDFLKFVAVEGNMNIAIAPDVNGMVNLLVNEVTIGDILRILFSTNSLAYQVQGNVIKVISNTEYKALQGVDFNDQRRTVIYQLKYASAQAVGTLLGNVKSDIGKIIFDDSTGILVIVDTPKKIREMDAVVKKSDISTISRVLPTETKVFELNYARVEAIQAEVTAALTPNVGTIRADVRTNTFVITDLPHKLKQVETIIRAFDRKIRQVFIEAKIIQVSLSDTYKWGIDWNRIFTAGQAGGLRGLSITPESSMSVGLTDTFGKLTVARTGTNTLDFVLETLSTIGETKILSNPHIATEEGKEATINVITKQPYSETTTTTTTAATTESTQFTFVDVGVKLNVTPTINKDGYISMLIKPEVSSITSFFPSESADQRVPVIETSNAESTVLIKDGTTIIIAGMIKDTKQKSGNKVPVIGDVPVVGKLFSNTTDTVQRSETIVFLTPRIISGRESFMLQRDMRKETKGIRK